MAEQAFFHGQNGMQGRLEASSFSQRAQGPRMRYFLGSNLAGLGSASDDELAEDLQVVGADPGVAAALKPQALAAAGVLVPPHSMAALEAGTSHLAASHPWLPPLICQWLVLVQDHHQPGED